MLSPQKWLHGFLTFFIVNIETLTMRAVWKKRFIGIIPASQSYLFVNKHITLADFSQLKLKKEK